MTSYLVAYLVAYLQSISTYTDWPLDELIAGREAFVRFVDEQWLAYVQRQSGHLLSESPPRYVLAFEEDTDLQDRIPSLVRSGTITPLTVDQPQRLPR